jgi:DNA repair exonuclease SbcCD nuclease subunit
MKVALLADTHFGARNDSRQFDEFFKKFYDEVFFPYIDEHQIKTVFHLGDVFDRRKYINFSILHSCKKYFFNKIHERNIDMFVIAGNHDTYYKNTNDVNSLQLLLKEYPNIQIIDRPCHMTFDNTQFMFSPWICADNYADTIHQLSQPTKYCIGHFEIDGFDMFRGIKNDGGLDRKLLKNFGAVFTGHFHHRSSQDNVFYLGSPYEFTWSDYDDARGFHILDVQSSDLTFVQNPYRMFHKVYYDDRKEMNFDSSQYKQACVKVIVVHKSDYVKFDKFIESLYINEVIELSIHEDFSDFESDMIDKDNINVEDTMTLLSDFVDATETSKDKEKLKTILKTLYVEAQSLEL